LFGGFAPWHDTVRNGTVEVRNRMATIEIGSVLLALCAEDPPPRDAAELKILDLHSAASEHLPARGRRGRSSAAFIRVHVGFK